MLLKQWTSEEGVIERARTHHAPHALHDHPTMLCTLATAAALTGSMPTPDQISRCARTLGISEDTREEIIDAAYLELQSVLEVL